MEDLAEAEFDKWVEDELEKIPIIILPKDDQTVEIEQIEETTDFEQMKLNAKYLKQYPFMAFRPRTHVSTPEASPVKTVTETPDSKRPNTGDGSAGRETLKAWATLHRLVSIAMRITC